MVPRFYDPDAGRVLVDGHDLRDLALRPLRRQIGVVFQKSFLFKGSVRDNIAYGRPEARDEEIMAAAQTCTKHSSDIQFERSRRNP